MNLNGESSYGLQLSSSATCPGSLYTCDVHCEQADVQNIPGLLSGNFSAVHQQSPCLRAHPLLVHPAALNHYVSGYCPSIYSNSSNASSPGCVPPNMNWFTGVCGQPEPSLSNSMPPTHTLSVSPVRLPSIGLGNVPFQAHYGTAGRLHVTDPSHRLTHSRSAQDNRSFIHQPLSPSTVHPSLRCGVYPMTNSHIPSSITPISTTIGVAGLTCPTGCTSQQSSMTSNSIHRLPHTSQSSLRSSNQTSPSVLTSSPANINLIRRQILPNNNATSSNPVNPGRVGAAYYAADHNSPTCQSSEANKLPRSGDQSVIQSVHSDMTSHFSAAKSGYLSPKLDATNCNKKIINVPPTPPPLPPRSNSRNQHQPTSTSNSPRTGTTVDSGIRGHHVVTNAAADASTHTKRPRETVSRPQSLNTSTSKQTSKRKPTVPTTLAVHREPSTSTECVINSKLPQNDAQNNNLANSIRSIPEDNHTVEAPKLMPRISISTTPTSVSPSQQTPISNRHTNNGATNGITISPISPASRTPTDTEQDPLGAQSTEPMEDQSIAPIESAANECSSKRDLLHTTNPKYTFSLGSYAVKPVNPAVYRRFMEQRMADVGRIHRERQERRQRLELEMAKVGLDETCRMQMRCLLRKKESNHMRMQRAKMDQTMFHRIKHLGVGAFGKVWLVRKKDSGQLYAMKLLNKRDVVERRQLAHVQAERDILAEADNEWVVKLFFSFQDAKALYLVMEYIPGGDMMSLLIKKGIFEEPLARFYIAELTLALESVHAMGFVHRDIKPDNILITRDGHIKLTDFGLCTGFRWTHSSKYWDLDFSIPCITTRRNRAQSTTERSMKTQDASPYPESTTNGCCRQERALSCAEDDDDDEGDDQQEHRDGLSPMLEVRGSCRKRSPQRMVYHQKTLERRRNSFANRRCAQSLVGTPNYIAPEILRRQDYGQSCDWWSVGVILYEMLVGQPPFLAQTATDTQIRVVQWHKYLKLPGEPRLKPDAGLLIRQLLRDPSDRLADPVKIKAHRFFDSIVWDKLTIEKAPYVPTIRGELDTSNFDPVEDEQEHGRQGSDVTGTSQTQLPFPNFTFKRFFDRDPTAIQSP